MALVSVAGKRIVLGVSGGIAAYKVVELARELTQEGASVKVVMTPSATKFVGPITFSTLTGNPVATDLFPDPSPPEITHTTLGRWADLVVVAPATANVIAKYAVGISDDILSALLLATRAPVLMAPAMHTEMWENEATMENVRTLSARGVRFVDPEVGPLAGPEEGVGRLAEIASIVSAIDEELGRVESLAGVRIVVTAGGTREPVDAVRFISNRSSGRMGYAIVEEASRRGAKVTLITGPTHLEPPGAAEIIRVGTAAEMKEAVLLAAEGSSVVIMAAAVADWRPTHRAVHKLKKSAGPPKLELEPTEDILEELAKRKGERILIGFSAESENLEEHATKELHSKSLDMVVANLIGAEDSGFDTETNRAVLLDRKGRIDRLPLMSKRELAGLILDALSERFL